MVDNTVTRKMRQAEPLNSLNTVDFLRVVGKRVRQRRTAIHMTRKRLAKASGVSERYLAQLESGQGNMSIALLCKVTTAIGLPLDVLMAKVEVEEAEIRIVELS